jgi:hypothetical protein
VHGAAFEYLRRDALDAPNYFDSTRRADGAVIQDLGKSALKQDQFGGSLGGPIAKNRAFFFGSFERYRLNAGINIVEAVPSAAAWSRAVPAIAALRSNFLAPGAVVLEQPRLRYRAASVPSNRVGNGGERAVRCQDQPEVVELCPGLPRSG